jgi:hypothetical protein
MKKYARNNCFSQVEKLFRETNPHCPFNLQLYGKNYGYFCIISHSLEQTTETINFGRQYMNSRIRAELPCSFSEFLKCPMSLPYRDKK